MNEGQAINALMPPIQFINQTLQLFISQLRLYNDKKSSYRFYLLKHNNIL